MKNEDYKMKNEECRMKNEYYLNLNKFFIRSEATIGYAELKVLHSSFRQSRHSSFIKASAFIAAFCNCTFSLCIATAAWSFSSCSERSDN